MRFSLDLHVLGTPPAFVLSQDQTLEKNFSENWLAQFWILTFFVKFAKTFWNWQGLKPCAIVVIVLLVLITAFLTVYFSNITSQLAFLLCRSCDSRLCRRLLLFPKNYDIVSFFGSPVFFWCPSLRVFLVSLSQERAYLSYHTISSLSSLFFDFFNLFSWLQGCLGATHLYYHNLLPLSSTFLN